MSRSINLESLYQMINNPSIYQRENIMKNFLGTLDDEIRDISKIQIKNRELETFKSLYEKIGNELTDAQKNGFYYGYKNSKSINQEFDLIRFTAGKTLNIELKYKYQKGGKKQLEYDLKRQNHILLNCTEKVYNYAYVLSDEKLYKLYLNKDSDSNDDYILKESNFSNLIRDISEDYSNINLLEKLVPSDLIISPYSEPEKFTRKSYYLNDKQQLIVKNILKFDNKYHCVLGGAGTGKSLVIFDLATKCMKMKKDVILVFCGKLENYSELSSIHKFDIVEIKSINNDISKLKKYDVVLFDEFQRIREENYEKLIKLNNELVVYSVDKVQTLHHKEVLIDIEEKLINNSRVKKHRLGEKIRQNNEMSWFIKKLLNPKNKKSQPSNFNKVSVKYFDNKETASNYIHHMNKCNKFIPIELTEYRTKTTGKKQRDNFLSFSKKHSWCCW